MSCSRLLPRLLGLCLLQSPLVFAAAGEVHEFKLDNGLQLLVKEDHRAPIVTSQVWYKVGSSYETEGKTGLSHMLEHLMFKGTPSHPQGEFSRIMAANGATENAFTSQDYTAYFQNIASDRLETSFELEADRMRNLLLDEAEFKKERQVVAEERRSRTEDNPSGVLTEQFHAAAYQTNPYHNPVIGWMSDIQHYEIGDLKAWYAHWYAPNNATVVVAGDVDPKAVLELAKKHFGKLAPSEIKAPAVRPEVKQLGMKRIVVKVPAKQPQLMMGYKTPVLKDSAPELLPDIYALELLAAVLDGGSSARLTKNLIRGQEIAVEVGAGYTGFERLETLFTFSGVPTQGHSVQDLEKAIIGQIQAIKDKGVEPAELARAKTLLRAAKVYERDSVFYQAMQLGTLATLGLDWRLSDSYLKEIEKVTSEQVQAAAQKYLIEDQLTVALLEPQPLGANQRITEDQPHTGAIR